MEGGSARARAGALIHASDDRSRRRISPSGAACCRSAGRDDRRRVPLPTSAAPSPPPCSISSPRVVKAARIPPGDPPQIDELPEPEASADAAWYGWRDVGEPPRSLDRRRASCAIRRLPYVPASRPRDGSCRANASRSARASAARRRTGRPGRHLRETITRPTRRLVCCPTPRDELGAAFFRLHRGVVVPLRRRRAAAGRARAGHRRDRSGSARSRCSLRVPPAGRCGRRRRPGAVRSAIDCVGGPVSRA